MKLTRNIICSLPALMWAATVFGCGSASMERHVLVSTEAGTSTSDEAGDDSDTPETVVEPHSSLEQRMLADQRRAADILKTVMCDGPGETAVWAGIYALSLGIKHDGECARRALLKGIRSDDVLVQALSWRRLAGLPEVDLPGVKKGGLDPVVGVMAALAHSRGESVPKDLKGALALPRGEVRGDDDSEMIQKRTAHLSALSIPFDDGPLALAIAFDEARRKESVEKGSDGQLMWSAQRLRTALVTSVDAAPADLEKITDTAPPGRNAYSTVSERLDNRLVTRPREMLHNIAMTGPDALRIEALRAIAIVAASPTAGDFGAAAAAMAADAPKLRVEGARTFLLLFLRLKK